MILGEIGRGFMMRDEQSGFKERRELNDFFRFEEECDVRASEQGVNVSFRVRHLFGGDMQRLPGCSWLDDRRGGEKRVGDTE